MGYGVILLAVGVAILAGQYLLVGKVSGSLAIGLLIIGAFNLLRGSS